MTGNEQVDGISALIIYSNPRDSERIRLDKETKSINKLLSDLRLSQDCVVQIHAAEKGDIFQAIGQRKFSVIQFSSHGNESGLLIEDQFDEKGAVFDAESIKEILVSSRPDLIVAIFMSCFSAGLAEKVLGAVPITISVHGSASDAGCIEFTNTFYRTLFRSGGSVSKAFFLAQAATKRDLRAAMFRRALQGNCNNTLVVHPSYGNDEILIDISNVSENATRLGLSTEDLAHLLSSKLRYHAWAFRYSRSNAIFPLGQYFCVFSWENPNDCIRCEKILKTRENIDEELSMVYANLLVCYHDCCVAEYRSPFFDQNDTRKINKSLDNLHDIVDSFLEDKKCSETLRKYVRQSYVNARAFCASNLSMADRKLKSGSVRECIPYMEAVLSSIHDLINEISNVTLE